MGPLDVQVVPKLVPGERIDVRVDLRNRGPSPIPGVQIEAELLGQVETCRQKATLTANGSASAALAFRLATFVPGVHALTLRLEYEVASAQPGAPPQLVIQPAYALVALGENAPPAVAIGAPGAKLDSVGRWRVTLESADGMAHRVRLRAVVPRSLRVWPVEAAVEVPAVGSTAQELLLFRLDAPWQTAQGALLVAATEGEPPTRTTVAPALVQVGQEPGVFRRLRWPTAGVITLLLLAAVGLECRRFWRAS